MQLVVVTFLYYARAIGPTPLPALNEISSQQSQPTQETMKKYKRLMNYADTHPNVYISFNASNMILMLDTDAAYIVITKAQSLISGYYYPINKTNSKTHLELNGAIIIKC